LAVGLIGGPDSPTQFDHDPGLLGGHHLRLGLGDFETGLEG
jgi:hypothetical protein